MEIIIEAQYYSIEKSASSGIEYFSCIIDLLDFFQKECVSTFHFYPARNRVLQIRKCYIDLVRLVTYLVFIIHR
jgi:hypothetical protein